MARAPLANLGIVLDRIAQGAHTGSQLSDGQRAGGR